MGEKKKLQFFHKDGRIYIPKEIRSQFEGCAFWVDVEDRKIVLNPVEIED